MFRLIKSLRKSGLAFFLYTFILPYSGWVLFHLGFIKGPYFTGDDGGCYFNWVIYHFEHILEGVYPLWNPFHNLGILDFLQIPIPGAFNPFLLIIPLLMKCQVTPDAAYMVFIIIYAGVFFLGFYCLLRMLCSNPYIALFGNVLLMFSSIYSEHIFYQTDLLTLLTPIIWFYVFLNIFIKSKTDNELCFSLLGMVLALWLVFNSYLPFPFLTVALCALTATLIVSPHLLGIFANVCGRLLSRHPLFALLAGLLLFAGFYPGLQCYLNIKDPQNVYMSARSSLQTGNDASVSQQAIQEGALFTKASFEELFSDFSTGAQFYVYVSNIIYLLFILFAVNKLCRKQVFIMITGLLLFLIAIGDVSPLQGFLYDHFFMFRLFRNYFYFWADLLVIILLFLMVEFDKFLNIKYAALPEKLMAGAWVLIVHSGFIVYLNTLENVPRSSYVMTILCGIWFLLWIFYGPTRLQRGFFMTVLCLIALIQPLDVLHYFISFYNTTMISREHPQYPMVFKYIRPASDPSLQYDNCYEYPKFRADDTGFCQKRYYGQRGWYILKDKISAEILKKYVLFKFVLYPSTAGMDYSRIDWKKIEAAMSGKSDQAVIDGPGFQAPVLRAPEYILRPDKHLAVIHFDANKVTLDVNFADKTFLVYNDNFHDQWRGLVDGKRTRLFRANYAFKGLWVPCGRHRIEFIFGNFFERTFYFSLIFIALFILLAVIYGFTRILLDRQSKNE